MEQSHYRETRDERGLGPGGGSISEEFGGLYKSVSIGLEAQSRVPYKLTQGNFGR